MTWLVVLAVGAGSFVFRLGPLLVFQRVKLPAGADRFIRHAGLAALTALIVTATKQAATGSHTVPVLLAVGVAAVLAARGRSMVRLLLTGGGLYVSAVIIIGALAR